MVVSSKTDLRFPESGQQGHGARIIQTQTKSKTSTYYNAANEKIWGVTVTGTFSYGNGTSTCLSASCTTSLYSNSWSVGNKKASKSGNTAKASATGVRYTNGHAVQSITRTVTLTCSATGNFS